MPFSPRRKSSPPCERLSRPSRVPFAHVGPHLATPDSRRGAIKSGSNRAAGHSRQTARNSGQTTTAPASPSSVSVAALAGPERCRRQRKQDQHSKSEQGQATATLLALVTLRTGGT